MDVDVTRLRGDRMVTPNDSFPSELFLTEK